MKLYLYETEVLRQKGSALRGMIRNSSTPILDLLVRESIQNSLDAADSDLRHRFVSVDYITGHFDKKQLNKELSGISLNSRPEWSNTFIAIRDSGTTGLTGSFKDETGNLYKLVFGIYEAQQASGAGGCWGVGKTIYFRIGTGLVIYYSRVRTSNGDYESLLSVAFVEDETKKDALLPPASDGMKYGIAWWGDSVRGMKRVRETRNESVINRVLESFGIKPYKEKQTGTTIIIPFTDENALLKNNQPEREDGNRATPFWTSSIPEYLKYSVQKWYSSRLGNARYPFGKRLNVNINGEAFDPKRDMEPFFQLTQALYNKAVLSLVGDPEADNIHYKDVELFCEVIKLRKQIDPTDAGCVAFAKVNRKDLLMDPPCNYPNPYEYIHSIVGERDSGKPIILFCRKPGMVVSYATDGGWTEGILKTEENTFLIAFFVLNSAAKLRKTSFELLLEDYVRKSEQADHLSWDDYTILEDNLRPSIIEKIKSNTAKKIESSVREAEEDADTISDTGLSNRLGGLLLPPEGFGRRPSVQGTVQPGPSGGGGSGIGGGGGSSVRRNVRYSYKITDFTAEGLVLHIRVSSGSKKAMNFGVNIDADSTIGSISALDWLKEMGITFPFAISSVTIVISKLGSDKIPFEYPVQISSVSESGPFSVTPRSTGPGGCFGLYFEFSDEEEHSFEVNLVLNIAVHRKDIRPSLSFD